MALHDLVDMELTVPDPDALMAFWEGLGLVRHDDATLGTAGRPSQLRVAEGPYRHVSELRLACSDESDLVTIRDQLDALGCSASMGDGSLRCRDPLGDHDVVVDVTTVSALTPTPTGPVNRPGEINRHNRRSAGAVPSAVVPPRRVGHVVFGSPDVAGSVAFYRDGLGFKVSDVIEEGIGCFLRCSTDHHNVLVMPAPVFCMNHYAMEMDDVDAIGLCGMKVLADRSDSAVYGIGRHVLGANLFWYLLDPAGGMFELFADMDQITDDDAWDAGNSGTTGTRSPLPRGSPARRRPTSSCPPTSKSWPLPERQLTADVDLGIRGRTALICASTRGLGRACAEALAGEGVRVVVNGRRRAAVDSAARDIADRFGVDARGVPADLSASNGRRLLLEDCPDLDILITNNAGPAPAVFGDVTADDWDEALQANMLAAIQLVQGVLPGMRERRFGRIVNITSAMVKSPHPLMTPSVGARAGLTAVMKAVAREVAVDNVTINNLLPERIDSGRQRQMAELAVAVRGITLEEAYAEMAATIPAGRLGRVDEVGRACAFLCADASGYLTGQNLQLDGGAYEGLL